MSIINVFMIEKEINISTYVKNPFEREITKLDPTKMMKI